MKGVCIVLLFHLSFNVLVGGQPHTRALRPEEQWRAAQPRDLSKYKPRHILFTSKQLREDAEMDVRPEPIRARKHWVGKTRMANEDCGREGPPAGEEGRIVGGEETGERQWPWMVAMFVDDAWFCGGSLVSNQYVLTAAHCVDGGSYFDLLVGAHNVRAPSEPHRVEITSYSGWPHPDWSGIGMNLAHDLALVLLPVPVTFNDYIQPVCLPEPEDEAAPGQLTTATGWGRPSDEEIDISPVLRMVQDLAVITNEECNHVYGPLGSGVVCVSTEGGRGTCNGDSGGPLNMKIGSKKFGFRDKEDDQIDLEDGSRGGEDGQRWKQVGIVSFGASEGCEAGLPAGFTRTEHYIQWITQEISKN